MSSTQLIILHCGHRKALRIGANDSMSTVVQMACREFGLDAGRNDLVLKHKRAVVDLSQPFRFTGIPQNATLDLVEEAPARRKGAGGVAGSGAAGGEVRVAARLPGGGRLQGSFSPDTTLLGILQRWAGRGELNPGVLEQGPSLQFMRSSYGAADLGSTTLRSIGLLTGSAMFTLSLSSPSHTTVATPAVPSTSGAPPAALPPTATAGAPSSSAGAAVRKDGDGAASPDAAAPRPSSGMTDRQSPTTSVTSAAPVAAVPPAPPSTGAVGAGGDGATSRVLTATAREASAQEEKRDAVASVGTAAGEEKPLGDAMEVEDGTPTASLPAMGVDVCRASLAAMSASHFDADSEACVLTLAKVVDNVVHRPNDSRTRQIRCGNAAFQQKVGRITGGISFLEGVGFVCSDRAPPQQILGGGGGRSGSAVDRFLVLNPEREDPDLLREARALLSKHAEMLGVPPERMPQPPRARPDPPAAAAGGGGGGGGGALAPSPAQAAFDPYKPFMTSTAPTPKGSKEQSATEKRLQELLAKRADVVSGGIPDRNIRATLPSQAAAAAASASSLEAGSRGGVAGERSSTGLGGGKGGDGERGDGGLLAKKVARQIAERKKREEVPFQTKAMREIERLQKATVYRTTVIKVQFPDRVVLQATFASTEGVGDLLEVVRNSLSDGSRGRKFELYVSPPRVVLKPSSSLADVGLVPAAVVYVSWGEMPPAGESEGGYLKPELTSGSAQAGAVAATPARPVGVALDEGARAQESMMGGSTGGSGRRLGSGTSGGASGGSGGGKRTGKPSWLKLNK